MEMADTPKLNYMVMVEKYGGSVKLNTSQSYTYSGFNNCNFL